MRYDISKPTAPKMPALDKGTECIKILLSQTSKDNYEPFVPMFFPVLGAKNQRDRLLILYINCNI